MSATITAEGLMTRLRRRMRRHRVDFLFHEHGPVITLSHRSDTDATRRSHCRRCSGASPHHWPGCPEDVVATKARAAS